MSTETEVFGTAPWVRVDTIDDEHPPLIIESGPFPSNEPGEWREATDEELERYAAHYAAEDDS